MASKPKTYSWGKDTGEDQEDAWWVNLDGNKDHRRVKWYDTPEEAKAECERLNNKEAAHVA